MSKGEIHSKLKKEPRKKKTGTQSSQTKELMPSLLGQKENKRTSLEAKWDSKETKLSKLNLIWSPGHLSN